MSLYLGSFVGAYTLFTFPLSDVRGILFLGVGEDVGQTSTPTSPPEHRIEARRTVCGLTSTDRQKRKVLYSNLQVMGCTRGKYLEELESVVSGLQCHLWCRDIHDGFSPGQIIML